MAAVGLELRGVRKTYGSNGAGKTTTMRVVLGTLIPDRGDVLWDGSPIGFEVRRRIGYMPMTGIPAWARFLPGGDDRERAGRER